MYEKHYINNFLRGSLINIWMIFRIPNGLNNMSKYFFYFYFIKTKQLFLVKSYVLRVPILN